MSDPGVTRRAILAQALADAYAFGQVNADPKTLSGRLWSLEAALDELPKPAWIVPDGYQPDGVGACSTCHQHVLWVHTRTGKRAPLDPDGISHFATCPQADQHRRTRPHPLTTLMPTDHHVEDHA